VNELAVFEVPAKRAFEQLQPSRLKAGKAEVVVLMLAFGIMFSMSTAFSWPLTFPSSDRLVTMGDRLSGT
jgi:hypothetical protein